MDKLALAALVAALAVSAFPRWWLRSDGRPHGVSQAAWWAAAVVTLGLLALCTPVNDDEVFWLTTSWASQHGEIPGSLPMRDLPFRPFLGLGASQMIIAGRVLVALLVGASAALCYGMLRGLRCSAATASVAAALVVLWLVVGAQMVLLRPECIACLLVLAGAWVLIGAPPRWPGSLAVAVAFVLFSLAASTSLRQAPILLGALVAVLLEPHGLTRTRAVGWAVVGALVGLLPSVVYVLLRDSAAELWYWNHDFMLGTGWLHGLRLPRLPLLLMGVAAVGAASLWHSRRDQPGRASTAVMWVTALLAVLLCPFEWPYDRGLLFAFSVCAGAFVAERLLGLVPSRGRRHLYLLVMVALGFPVLVRAARQPALHPSRVPAMLAEVRSQLDLLDWLQATGRGGPVYCVSPYHPIAAFSVGHSYDAWVYCYLWDPGLIRRVSGPLETAFTSGEPTIIAWDPWPEKSGYANVLARAVGRGLIPAERASAVAEQLAAQYRLVRWARRLPGPFGGGRFLVRRDLIVEESLVVQEDPGVVRDWDASPPPASG